MSCQSCCIARGDSCLGESSRGTGRWSWKVRCPKPREGSPSPAASELPSGNSFLATAPPYLCSDLSWFSASVGGLGDKADAATDGGTPG